MPVDEETEVSSDSLREAKPDTSNQQLHEGRASMCAPVNSVVHAGRKPMFRTG